MARPAKVRVKSGRRTQPAAIDHTAMHNPDETDNRPQKRNPLGERTATDARNLQ
jgi:hypothetical protein